MSCKIHAALNQAWADATLEFSNATAALAGAATSKMSNDEYLALRAAADSALLASENARVILDLHRKEHNC